MNRCHACANRALSDFELAFAGNQRGVTDLYPFDVGNGVVYPRSSVEGNAQIAGAGLCLSRENHGQNTDGCGANTPADTNSGHGASGQGGSIQAWRRGAGCAVWCAFEGAALGYNRTKKVFW